MAFAKLSGSLLVRREKPVVPVSHLAPTPSAAAAVPVAPALPVTPEHALAPVIAPTAPIAPMNDDLRHLAQDLRALKLPAFARECERLARQCRADGVDHAHYLSRLAELELAERKRSRIERRIKDAQFPAVKTLESFNFAATPSLDENSVRELAQCDYIRRRENIIVFGNSGTGKTHLALGLGLAACQKNLSVGFATAAALVHELIESHAERRVLRLQRRLDAYSLLIIDELGYVPLSAGGAEMLFEVLSRRCERGSTIITSNLPTGEWTSIFGTDPLTDALLDRLTCNVHVFDMSGESYRSRQTQRLQHGFAGTVIEPLREVG